MEGDEQLKRNGFRSVLGVEGKFFGFKPHHHEKTSISTHLPSIPKIHPSFFSS